MKKTPTKNKKPNKRTRTSSPQISKKPNKNVSYNPYDHQPNASKPTLENYGWQRGGLNE